MRRNQQSGIPEHPSRVPSASGWSCVHRKFVDGPHVVEKPRLLLPAADTMTAAVPGRHWTRHVCIDDDDDDDPYDAGEDWQAMVDLAGALSGRQGPNSLIAAKHPSKYFTTNKKRM